MLTVTASEARANFSKLGEEIARTGKPVTVFKNSKPWLVITPVSEGQSEAEALTVEEMRKKALELATEIDKEYYDVFEALAK